MHRGQMNDRSDVGHRKRVVAAAALTAVVALCATWAAPAGAAGTLPHQAPAAASLPDPGWAESDFVSRINQLRAAHGLGALSVDPELTTQARQWASTMAGAGHIYHSGDLSAGVSSDWQKLGENVGVGGDTASLFQAFVDSPSHYENLVDPAYTRVGVGVVLAGGRLYTTHRFMGLMPPPAPTTVPTTAPPTTVAPTTTTTAAPTTVAPPPPTTAAPAARKLGPIERIPELLAGPAD